MQGKDDPGFALVSLIIIGALGISAWNSPPLQSARPTGDPLPLQENRFDDRVPARLWQDPFKAVQVHKQSLRAKQSCDRDRRIEKSSLQTDVYRALREAKGDNDELLILVASVNPGFSPDTEEHRRRRRYAVLSGLGHAGYAPRDAGNLGLQRRPAVELAGPPVPSLLADHSSPLRIDSVEIPYEWYDLEDDRSGKRVGGRSALVLWLDESWLGNSPFQRLNDLVDWILPKGSGERRKVRWVTLGPSRSGTLRKMVAARKDGLLDPDAILDHIRKASGLGSFHILSPSATVDDCDLDPKLRGCPREAELGFREPNPLLGAEFTQPCDGETTCMRFLRTVRSDATLIERLAAELEIRGIEAEDTIFVLSEWDTYFGRSLPRALAATNGNGWKLRRFTYERGMDGLTSATTPPSHPSSQSRRPSVSASDDEIALIRRPQGASQFDYLRRLARTIREEDEKLYSDTGRGVKAVVILGSDVYDKLLVLRALRDTAPAAIWLTTDLDANLAHPDEFAWARNLIVASTYDLELVEKLQASSPPFRTSYQTSVYLATLMAATPGTTAAQLCTTTMCDPGEPFPGQRGLYESMPPLLFEVGRQGFVKLADSPGRGSSQDSEELAPPFTSPQRTVSRIDLLSGGLLIAILAIVMLHQLRPRSGRPVLAFSALLLVLALLGWAAVASVEGGEPLRLSAGVSIWPTILIRAFTAWLTVVFVWIVLRRLPDNWALLDHRYFDGPKPTFDDGLKVRDAWKNLRAGRPQAWSVGCAVLLLVLIATMQVLRLYATESFTKLLVTAVIFAVIIAFWLLFIFAKWPFARGARIRSINRWTDDDSCKSAVGVWQLYQRYGEKQHRILRSAAIALIYFAAASLVFGLLGSGQMPCRGKPACIINGLILCLSVLFMLFLLFLVVDAIRLCMCWIEKIQRPDLRWNGSAITKLAVALQLPETHAAYWLQVHLIGERTREVSRLLYYPLVVILLMLLARSTYFDNWGFPMALAIVVGANFTIALGAAAKLNATAVRTREEIIARLRKEGRQLAKSANATPPPVSRSEIHDLIEDLSKLNLGAYQRPWEQPLIRAAFLLITGLALTYTEYLRMMY